MTPEAERHRRAAELFEQAVELPRDRWQSFVESACGQDLDLLRRVMALLEAERKAPESFMAQPAMHLTAKQLVDKAALLTGTQLGNYLVGSQVGAGGMGTVYEARDIRLDRKVAIKVLPPAFVEDPDRVGRFRKEARAASMLNHPNIVSIYDAELDRGRYYIATEFVEGKTLRQMVDEGPADPKQLIDIATQICSALAAAHEAGIVHRDIKPENIMVRPDGIVKVLDFGLAKLREPVSGESTPGLETRPGNIAGTLQYLAPEQVTGKPAGPRSDLFSLGVVLYELATGVRPFQGATDGAIFAAILLEIPAFPMQFRPSIDRELDSLIMRAIEKDPELRFQSANDMHSALRLLARGPQLQSPSGPLRVAPLPLRHRWNAPAISAIAGMALMGGLWFALSSAPALPLPIRFDPMTFGEGEQIYPNLAPDGKLFIYASPARGKWDIYLQRVGGSAEINLTADSAADSTEPALSRDGSRIAFRSERGEGGLFIMEATGESPRRISGRGHLPAWSPDGKAIVYCDDTFIIPNDRGAAGSRLHVLDLSANTERNLAVEDAVQPNWSPHGRRIAYWGIRPGGNREVFTVAADGGAPVQVTDDPAVDWNPVWSPSGSELYFISDRGGTMNLWRVPIDETTGKTGGRPLPVTTPAVYMRFLSWSADGAKFLYSQAQNRISLAAIEFDLSRLETAGSPFAVGGSYNIGNFSLSPDETKIVHDTVGDVHEDLWIVNVDGSGRRKLTSDSFRNRLPRWSPQGDQVLFISNRSGRYQEWVIRTDGSGLRQLTDARGTVNTGVWIEGGRRIVASLFGSGLALIDPAAASSSPIVEPERLPGIDKLNGFSYAFTSTPQNGLLLGHIAGNGENPIVLYSLTGRKLTRLGVRGMRPAWIPGPNNRYFVFLREDACFLYDREQKREKRLFSTPRNQMYFMQISSSGRRIFFSRTVRDAHLWMGVMSR